MRKSSRATELRSRWWRETAPSVTPFLDAGRRELLHSELEFQSQCRFQELPRAPIHADLFRDNVLFELGLFMGRLGRSRTFVVRPRHGDVKLPSDLAGVTAALYDWPRSDNDKRAAVGPACDELRRAIRSLGVLETRAGAGVQEVKAEQERQKREIVSHPWMTVEGQLQNVDNVIHVLASRIVPLEWPVEASERSHDFH